MLKKIFTNHFVIAGLVIFLILLGVFVFALDLSWGESLLASAALTVVGIGAAWWQDFWPW
jgi:hypothetical protein